MGEIRIVIPGKTRGYPYPVCKKRIVGPGETREYPYPVCKKTVLYYGCLPVREINARGLSSRTGGQTVEWLLLLSFRPSIANSL